MMRLFVIMANDFPAGIMDNEKAAEALVAHRNAADKLEADKQRRSRVFWHAHPFTINEVGACPNN